MSYMNLLGQVTKTMELLKVNVDEALRLCSIPADAAEWIKSELAAPVTMSEPAVVISENQPIPYCDAPEVPRPGRDYLSGLEEHLVDHRRWSRSVVNEGATSLRHTSKLIVDRFPDPKTDRTFVAKGLVLGYVQSGKTANMAAVICRAADLGYGIVVVLAGLYNDLRAQTQNRLDQDVVGRSDTSDGPFVTHPGLARWGRWTSSGINGDFQTGTIDDISLNSPKLAVMKKHPRVLARFIQWLEQNPELKRQPTLIIDDEADQASINSNYGRVDDSGNEVDPTATNREIRNLVQSFARCTYVGFTATPFANVLIDVSDEADLFPSDFIVCLHEPSGYFGARQLFGLGMPASDLSPELSSGPELDILRSISADDGAALSGMTEDDDASPDILRKALLSFILSNAARLQRNQSSHFSMLVHPSGRRDDHRVYAAVLRKDLERLKTQLANRTRFPTLSAELKALWELDFAPTTIAAAATSTSFDTIAPFLYEAVRDIELKLIHQGSPDTLDYSERGPRRRYVVVGGNRLSRGLTLEGLSVSLFVRSANYYDTLLQMGRWFGYRNGYADLTRIFVDDRTAEEFADLARIELELRADLEKYRDRALTPREVVPIIRAHPRLDPTAPNRQGAANNAAPVLRNVKQVVRFPFDIPEALESNIRTAREFLRSIGQPSQKSPDWWLWRKRPKSDLLRLVGTYQFADVPILNRSILGAAIESLPGDVTWDVIIPQASGDGFQWLDERSTVMLNRMPLTASSIKVLRESKDVARWKQDGERAKASVFFYAVNPSFGRPGLRFRRTDVPLVGLAFVFPEQDLRDASILSRLPPPGYIGQPNVTPRR